jgi:hypothetical protein
MMVGRVATALAEARVDKYADYINVVGRVNELADDPVPIRSVDLVKDDPIFFRPYSFRLCQLVHLAHPGPWSLLTLNRARDQIAGSPARQTIRIRPLPSNPRRPGKRSLKSDMHPGAEKEMGALGPGAEMEVLAALANRPWDARIAYICPP